MKNAESFIVWTGNVYGDWDRCLDIWPDVFRTKKYWKLKKIKRSGMAILIILLIFYSIYHFADSYIANNDRDK